MTTERFCDAGDGRTFMVGTSRVSVKVEDGEPAAAFSLIEWLIPPGAPAPPRHIHREGSETFYVLEGTLWFPMASSTVKATAGSCLHIPPGTAHTLTNEGDAPARALELFVPARLMGLVEGVGRLLSDDTPPDRDRLMALFAAHDSEIVG